jgi:hypothetical protein
MKLNVNAVPLDDGHVKENKSADIYVACTEKFKNTYCKALVIKSEWKVPLRKPRLIWEVKFPYA